MAPDTTGTPASSATVETHPGEPFPLRLLLEDGPLLAFNKPAGLLTQGVPHGAQLAAGGEIPTLESQVKAFLKSKYNKPAGVYLGIPHRLDRAVSGVVVFAKNSKAAARLAEQFRDRQVRKVYWALVETPPTAPAGTLEDWLLKDPAEAHVTVVPPGTAGAKLARLSYRVLPTLPHNLGGKLLEIELETGRMHQIRVQLASRGWPIWGDLAYGATHPWAAPTANAETADARLQTIALHARKLILQHPVRYDEVSIEAPLPEPWQTALGPEDEPRPLVPA